MSFIINGFVYTCIKMSGALNNVLFQCFSKWPKLLLITGTNEIYRMSETDVVLRNKREKKWLNKDKYLSISDPMSRAISFRSPRMLLRSSRPSSCFIFSTYSKKKRKKTLVSSYIIYITKSMKESDIIYLNFLNCWWRFSCQFTRIWSGFVIWQP